MFEESRNEKPESKFNQEWSEMDGNCMTNGKVNK